MTEAQAELERRATRAATAIRMYHAAAGMATNLRHLAIKAETELLEVLPESGQIVKTEFGTVERKARPRSRRSPNRVGIDDAYEDLPVGLREQVTREEFAVVQFRSIPAEIHDVIRERAEKVDVEVKYPTVAAIERFVPEGELRDRLITTPPPPPDEILLDGIGVDAVKMIEAS
jgi:hypothetical protein